jgi:alginate O-acetyltransferase complex protein AlgI
MYTNPEFFAVLVIVALMMRIPWLRTARVYLLAAANCYVAYRLDPVALKLSLILTAFTYLMGLGSARSQRKRLMTGLGITGLLITLGVFKYLGMLDGILQGVANLVNHPLEFHIENLVAPLGLSYLIFRHISYLLDLEWGLIGNGRIIDFFNYSCLFTTFVAGPIDRFERLEPQLRKLSDQVFHPDYAWGFQRIVFGLAKKLILADWIGYFTSTYMASPSYGLQAVGLLGYTFQIYFDFAGYSDIAIGASSLLGLRVMENFNNPYLAPSIGQFWRRWHISLSDWIRDYLFFPLSRVWTAKLWQIVVVPLVAMGLCGLWHGGQWHFVGWGLWHGAGLATHQGWLQARRRNKTLNRLAKQSWYTIASTLLTFLFVSIGWVWFK